MTRASNREAKRSNFESTNSLREHSHFSRKPLPPTPSPTQSSREYDALLEYAATLEDQVEELHPVSGEANTVNSEMAASATTTSITLSEDILTEMRADQKERAAQMKRLKNLVADLSTASPTPPAPPQTSQEQKSTAHLRKLQEEMGDSHRRRVHGVRGERRQTLAKLEDQTQIVYNGGNRKER